MALIVAQGNPLRIANHLDSLKNRNYRVVIGNPEMSSCGRESREILQKEGLYDEVLANALFLTADSKDLIEALLKDQADLTFTWRATIFSPQARDRLEAVTLPAQQAPTRKLLIGLLRYSINPDLARAFIKFTASPEGAAIFAAHGFARQ